MSAKARETVIGGFVVGAVALVVGALILFGGGRLFRQSQKYVLFFDGSVMGLQVGAPVLTNGVKVGTVEELRAELDLENLSFLTAVTIEIDSGSIGIQGGEARLEEVRDVADGDLSAAREKLVRMLVDRGLRAQLRQMSFVTGQLGIEFTFRPGSALRLVGGAPLPELPTIPSEMERLRRTLQDLPFEEIVADMKKILEGINDLVGSAELRKTSVAISTAAENLSGIVEIWKRRSDGIAQSLEKALEGIGAAATKIDGRIDPVAAEAEETLKAAREAMDQARETLEAVEGEMGSGSALIGELRSSLKAFVRAMDSLRNLADYLERHPDAILRGK